jgi:hypothetical protein
MREVFDRCRAAPDLRDLPDHWRRLGQVSALFAHLTTFALIAGAVIVAFSPVLLVLRVLLVIVLVGFAFEVRPRLGAPPKGVELPPENAPVLWSVVTELCTLVGARVPHALFIRRSFSADYGAVGVKKVGALSLALIEIFDNATTPV